MTFCDPNRLDGLTYDQVKEVRVLRNMAFTSVTSTIPSLSDI